MTVSKKTLVACLVIGAASSAAMAPASQVEPPAVPSNLEVPEGNKAGVARATWQHSKDTSSVWAVAIQSSTDPGYVTPGAIPWLLLRIVGAQAGAAGGEKLVPTTFIQRVHTAGGSAPSPTCSQAGARVFVPYETDYVFYKAH